MKFIKNATHWVSSQFKQHTLRSVLITGSVLALATAAFLWPFGRAATDEFTYLPNRAYILADTENAEPQTLNELLHSTSPSVDSLLRNPDIAAELLSAETLLDIVDSRMALHNLRELDAQLSERFAEAKADSLQLLDMPSYVPEEMISGPIAPPVGEPPKTSTDTDTPDTTEPSKVEPDTSLPTTSAPGTDTEKPSTTVPTVPPFETNKPAVPVSEAYASQIELISQLRDATGDLLGPPLDTELQEVVPNLNMKSVWQNPGENLLHMTPSGDWIPNEGFLLYRIIDGERELVKDDVAATAKGKSGDIEIKGWEIYDQDEYEQNKHLNINPIAELYKQAEVTSEKLASMGMSNAEEFRKSIYRANLNDKKLRVSGDLDFEKMRELGITIPASIGQKIPDTDNMFGSTVYVQDMPQNSSFFAASLQKTAMEMFSLKSVSPMSGLSQMEGTQSFGLAYEIFTARQQLTALSFVDDEFADMAGFLFRDELSGLELKDGTEIAYHVETQNGTLVGRTFITYGKPTDLSKPQGLKGYGVDGKVPLRWELTENNDELGIITGYIIERKLKGEKNFVRANEEPVVISYVLDETGIYFESPAFFEDKVENGETVTYRIYSIDIFGRTSPYSDTIEFKVEKITPPNAPSISTPALSVPGRSASKTGDTDTFITEEPLSTQHSVSVDLSIQANKNKDGIVLPIFTDTPDTVRFTIYRAVAVGARGFGPPEILSNIKYDSPMPPQEDPTDELGGSQYMPSTNQLEEKKGKLIYDGKSVTAVTTVDMAKQIVMSSAVVDLPDLTFFDADVQEGHTYKYWVSAWDSWNNESAWSQSVTLAFPTEEEPEIPDSLNIKMLIRELIDLSELPPGVFGDRLISYEDLANASAAMRTYEDDTDTNTVQLADSTGVNIGNFTPTLFPEYVAEKFDNLPADKYIHMLIGVRGEDVFPNGTARLKWPAYSGDGLEGYMIYRPLFSPGSLDEMQKMSRNDLVAMGNWQLVNNDNKATVQNQLVIGGLEKIPGDIHIFLICLKPTSSAIDDLIFNINSAKFSSDKNLPLFRPYDEAPAGGYVSLSWETPKDPLVQFYRIYRCEVSKQEFQQGLDPADIEWTLIGDHIKSTNYTDPVEQSFAHYYYYKVTSVSPWSVESTLGTVKSFRVPSTKPPQTPNLLLPLSRKDGVQVNFASVNHCDWYEIYRVAIPKPSEAQLADMMSQYSDLFGVLFEAPSKNDFYLSDLLTDSLDPLKWKALMGSVSKTQQQSSLPSSGASPLAMDNVLQSSAVEDTPIMTLRKFKTLVQLDDGALMKNLAAIDTTQGLKAYQTIFENFGPLALSDYSNLSIGMLEYVGWKKIGTVSATEQEADPTGLLKPLSFIDETAQYGISYLYTVQAWNDDNLGSMRSEPLEATPRRSGPFDPIDGLKGELADLYPQLTWNAPTMKNLTSDQVREDTVGYIVYRSDTADGTYYQASPLLFVREWTDTEADLFAYNWYRVKVLDTGGYLSEFSDELLVQGPFYTDIETIIPDTTIKVDPPVLTLSGNAFSVLKGTAFSTKYELAGTEPIEITLSARDSGNKTVAGFAVNMTTRTISAPTTLPVGTYTVTLKAENSAGESTKSFTLEVRPLEIIVTPPKLTLEAQRFIVTSGTSFQTTYTLTGTQPITVTIKAEGPDGGVSPGTFTVDTSTRTISAPPDLAATTYNVTVTAKNSAGESSKSFYLTVESAPIPVAPTLERREDDYNFTMYRTLEFSKQLYATGSMPMTWSLEPSSRFFPVPEGASIDDYGLLTVDKNIPAGNYRFRVKVENSAGFDVKEIFLEVRPWMLPGGGGIFADYENDISPPGPAVLHAQTTSGVTTVQTLPTLDMDIYKSVRVRCMGFTLSDVDLSRPKGGMGQLLGYSGTALLNLGNDPVLVKISGAAVEKASGTGLDEITHGAIYIEEPTEFKDIGLTIISLNILPETNKAEISGYIKNPDQSLNVLGNRYAIQFKFAELRPGFIVIKRGLPTIKYNQFTINELESLWINTAYKDTFDDHDLFTLSGGTVELKSHLETLDNKDLLLKPAHIGFNHAGEMDADLFLEEEQALRFLVPGGSALRVDRAFLAIRRNVPQSNSHLGGKLVLPFEEAGLQGPGVPGEYVGGRADKNEMDEIINQVIGQSSGDMSKLQDEIQKALVKYGERAQQNGLLVVPDDFELQDQCSFVEIDVEEWTGAGFVIEVAKMTPANMAERSLDIDKQRSQGIVITPTTVSVDLDRDGALLKQESTVDEKIMTPKETEKPFWVGLVMHGGTVALPTDFIEQDGGGAIKFSLAKGEMIYDLNGFNYQTYLYSEEGVPADFSKALGNFPDVWVYDCLLDLYANRVNLEINAEVAVDLFRGERVEAKLFTNKKDNANGKKGELLCSVAPTVIVGAPSSGIDLTIDGGWFREDGMHISGSMTIELDEVNTNGDSITFTDMVVPADIKKSGALSMTNRKYSSAELDHPINIDFQGFTMEIRALDMTYKEHPSKNVLNSDIALTLHGATLISDNIPLASETLDELLVHCPIGLADAGVVYEQSYSVLNTSFDGCVDVVGTLVPESLKGDEDGLVEFDTEQLDLSFLSQLKAIQVKVSARFGFDMHNKRCYFVLGIATGEGIQIPFGAGRLKDFAGIISYNVIAERDKYRRLQIPNYAGLEDFIKNRKVDREGGSGFVAGISATLVITELCEIRNMYFAFQSGPIVDAGGDLYLPLDIGAMVSDGSPYTKIGSVIIFYSHPEKYFSFTIVIDFNVIMARVGGTLGFEYSPSLFGVYLGYPEMLGGQFGILIAKVGVGYIAESGTQKVIRMRAAFGYSLDLDIKIVFISAHLYAEAEGAYHFGGSEKDRIELELFLKGGIKGGIWAMGSRHYIISMQLDAQGRMESEDPYTSWYVAAKCNVSYSLNIWIHTFEGTVSADFSTTLGK